MISWMIRVPYEITEQLAVGTQNCLSTLFYIKTSAQNTPLADKKNPKLSGEGAQPPPQTHPPLGKGIPLPDPTPLVPRFLRHWRSAFPFLFIYDSNTDLFVQHFCSSHPLICTILATRTAEPQHFNS